MSLTPSPRARVAWLPLIAFPLTLGACGDDPATTPDTHTNDTHTADTPDTDDTPDTTPPTGFSETPVVFRAEFGPGNGQVCYDIGADAAVDCATHADAWDLMFEIQGASWSIWTNGAVHGDGHGLAFGPMTTALAQTMGAMANIPGWFPDLVGGAFLDQPWQTYNVLGAHDISANQRVYVVRTPTADYRFQILSYYSPAGTSALLQLRYGVVGESKLTTLEVDARAGGFGAAQDHPDNKFTYLDLDAGQIVDLSDEEAKSDTTWDLAFKRTELITNSGISGPGASTSAVAVAQAHLYGEDGQPIRAQFEALTTATADAAFDSVTSADGLTFVADRGRPFIINDGGENSWFRVVSFAPPTFAANPDVWWAVRGAQDDVAAKLHVTEVQRDANQRVFTVELFVQHLSSGN